MIVKLIRRKNGNVPNVSIKERSINTQKTWQRKTVIFVLTTSSDDKLLNYIILYNLIYVMIHCNIFFLKCN